MSHIICKMPPKISSIMDSKNNNANCHKVPMTMMSNRQ